MYKIISKHNQQLTSLWKSPAAWQPDSLHNYRPLKKSSVGVWCHWRIAPGKGWFSRLEKGWAVKISEVANISTNININIYIYIYMLMDIWILICGKPSPHVRSKSKTSRRLVYRALVLQVSQFFVWSRSCSSLGCMFARRVSAVQRLRLSQELCSLRHCHFLACCHKSGFGLPSIVPTPPPV